MRRGCSTVIPALRFFRIGKTMAPGVVAELVAAGPRRARLSIPSRRAPVAGRFRFAPIAGPELIKAEGGELVTDGRTRR